MNTLIIKALEAALHELEEMDFYGVYKDVRLSLTRNEVDESSTRYTLEELESAQAEEMDKVKSAINWIKSAIGALKDEKAK